MNSDHKTPGCAASCCRKAATVRVEKDDMRLLLCDRHARVYRSLGYAYAGYAHEPVTSDEGTR